MHPFSPLCSSKLTWYFLDLWLYLPTWTAMCHHQAHRCGPHLWPVNIKARIVKHVLDLQLQRYIMGIRVQCSNAVIWVLMWTFTKFNQSRTIWISSLVLLISLNSSVTEISKTDKVFAKHIAMHQPNALWLYQSLFMQNLPGCAL